MTKQPDPGRPSLPRPGSALPASVGHDPQSAPPVVPKLPTLAPRVRRPLAASTDDQRETLTPVRRQSKSANPFAAIGKGLGDVDLELVRQGVQAPCDASDPQTQSLVDRIVNNRNPFSSMLISTIFHTALLLIMALIAFGLDEPDRSIGIVATIDLAPALTESTEIETEPVEIEVPNENASPVEMSFDATSFDSTNDTANTDFESPNVVAEEKVPVPAETNLNPVTVGVLPTGGGLEGRSESARAQLAAKRGGTRASEFAVEQGLRWIIAHQRKDGSWRFFHDDGRCNGECQHQGTKEASTAATGLALMSLLGAGYTHQSGPYQEQVGRGLNFLVDKMRLTQRGGNLTSGSTGMYAHAIATIALSEALTMTNDTALINPVEQARKYIETAQHKRGGWRYDPGDAGDLSVTGWQLMALKSCEMSGARTGKITYQLAEDFVDSLAASSRGYGYQAPAEHPTMTAVGVLSKMYLGAELNEGTLENSTRLLSEHGFSPTDVYFNYYATQVLHHRHDPDWDKWNEEQRDYLIQTQDRTNSHQAGSWYFADHHGQVGGRLYTTAMAVMILEVYYRYMPLYEEDAVKAIN